MPGAKYQSIGGIFLDWNEWPVVLVRPPPRPVELAELDVFIRDGFEARVQQRGEPYTVVLDLSDARQMGSAQRRHLAEALARINEGNRLCLGTALTVRSPIMRSLVTAVQWVFRAPYPVKTFADLPQALQWARRQVPAEKRRVG